MAILAVENFQAELEKARETLHKVDENIKKITGRDPAEARQARLQAINNIESRENAQSNRSRVPPRFQGRLSRDDELKRDGPPPSKRIVREEPSGRPAPMVAVGNPKGYNDRDDEDYEEGELPHKKAVHSSVVSTSHGDRKTREDVLAQQSKDTKVKDRNRRIFGSLLGTLAKFRKEETSLKEKEDKRAKIEKRLEENARQEQESIRKEKHELFLVRKRTQANVRRLEWKMHRLREHEEWAARQKPLMNFIKSKTTPPVYYKPKMWCPKTEELLQESQRQQQEMLETRRKELEEELLRVEEKANAREERAREKGDQAPVSGDGDAELEELEAEIELYSMALGEEKEEDMELNPAEAVQGPLSFPKPEPDEPMESA